MRDDIAVFILTHGRASNQRTLKWLQAAGYTGNVYFIVDDEDEQKSEYTRLYGDKVKLFSKREIETTFDTMTNRHEYCAVVYARNASYQIAKELGVRWIMMCDDDIFCIRARIAEAGRLTTRRIHDMDRILERMAETMEAGNMAAFGFSKVSAYIGGTENAIYRQGHQRRIAQAFMVDADNPLVFRGLFFEDLQGALDAGIQGRVAMSTALVSVQSPSMASNDGGMQSLYADNSTYVPCLFTVMAYPSVARISENSGTFKVRLNHKAFAPMILREDWKK